MPIHHANSLVESGTKIRQAFEKVPLVRCHQAVKIERINCKLSANLHFFFGLSTILVKNLCKTCF